MDFLCDIGAGLEDYQLDHGIYPLHLPDSGNEAILQDTILRDQFAATGAHLLYSHLSGDFDGDGRVDDGAVAYVDRLDLESQRGYPGRPSPKELRAIETPGGPVIVDPFGVPIRYLSAPPDVPMDQKGTRNPTYDLWSLGGGSADTPETWITNWSH